MSNLNDTIKAILVRSNTDAGEEIICSVLADEIERAAKDFAIEQLKEVAKEYYMSNMPQLRKGGTFKSATDSFILKIKQLEQ